MLCTVKSNITQGALCCMCLSPAANPVLHHSGNYYSRIIPINTYSIDTRTVFLFIYLLLFSMYFVWVSMCFDKHFHGNEHCRWWTNHMIAFITASYRGDIYHDRKCDELSISHACIYSTCAYLHTHTHTLWITDILSRQPYLMHLCICASDETLITLSKTALCCF